jgi:hypothetical protein
MTLCNRQLYMDARVGHRTPQCLAGSRMARRGRCFLSAAHKLLAMSDNDYPPRRSDPPTQSTRPSSTGKTGRDGSAHVTARLSYALHQSQLQATAEPGHPHGDDFFRSPGTATDDPRPALGRRTGFELPFPDRGERDPIGRRADRWRPGTTWPKALGGPGACTPARNRPRARGNGRCSACPARPPPRSPAGKLVHSGPRISPRPLTRSMRSALGCRSRMQRTSSCSSPIGRSGSSPSAPWSSRSATTKSVRCSSTPGAQPARRGGHLAARPPARARGDGASATGWVGALNRAEARGVVQPRPGAP